MTTDEFLARCRQAGMVLGLDTMRQLMDALGHPEEDISLIHIAGTNGKGSVGTILTALLGAAGFRTGRYLSPAVLEEREIIQLQDGMENRLISPVEWEEAGQVVCAAAEKAGVTPTEFEAQTAMAFVFFARNKCQYAVIETGMGGRLDATNFITHPVCCILTSISLDHTRVLGDTLAAIAGEKAGIIKQGVPVVIGRQEPEAAQVIEGRARELSAPVYHVGSAEDVDFFRQNRRFFLAFTFKGERVTLGLAGAHQVENALLAFTAMDVLGLSIHREILRDLSWPGRFELLSENPDVIADGAHNPGAAEVLVHALNDYVPQRPVSLVMGMFRDKDCARVLQILRARCDRLYAFTTHTDRAMPAEELAQIGRKLGYQALVCRDALSAMRMAKSDARVQFMESDKEVPAEQRENQRPIDRVILAAGSLSFQRDLR